MKRFGFYFLFVLILTYILVGCDKFLDVKPKGKDIPRTIDHYNGLFNNNNLVSLGNFRSLPSGATAILGNADLPLYMSDDIYSSSAYLTTNTMSQQNAFRWLDNVFLPDEDPNDWGAFYVQNYIYNLIANDVMDAEDGTPETKKQLQAEARANRAYMHFFVLNYFGIPYNAATASTYAGVPIVTQADVGQTNFTRATVKEVYDFVIAELTESIPQLSAQTISRLRLSQAGGYFMLGQVYFQMGDYANALTALKNCQNNLSNTAVPFALYNYNTTMNSWYSPSAPWRGASGHPNMFNSTENIYVKQMPLTSVIQRNCLYVKQNILNLFASDDLRLRFFYNKNQQNGTITLPGTQRNSPTAVNWGSSLPNLYLMLAECKARTNDLTGAKQDVETLRKMRMPAASATVPSLSQNDFIKFILNERQREFAGTGMRWFDMRRLANDATFNNLDGKHQLDADTYTLRPERLTLKIPPKILAYNPAMKDNQ